MSSLLSSRGRDNGSPVFETLVLLSIQDDSAPSRLVEFLCCVGSVVPDGGGDEAEAVGLQDETLSILFPPSKWIVS